MRDVVDAGKRAPAIHRGVALDVLPRRAALLRGGRAEPLSGVPGDSYVAAILRALESRGSVHCLATDWEGFHGDGGSARRLGNVLLRRSRDIDRCVEAAWKPRSCGNSIGSEADWRRRSNVCPRRLDAPRGTLQGSPQFQEV